MLSGTPSSRSNVSYTTRRRALLRASSARLAERSSMPVAAMLSLTASWSLPPSVVNSFLRGKDTRGAQENLRRCVVTGTPRGAAPSSTRRWPSRPSPRRPRRRGRPGRRCPRPGARRRACLRDCCSDSRRCRRAKLETRARARRYCRIGIGLCRMDYCKKQDAAKHQSPPARRRRRRTTRAQQLWL